MTNEGTTLWTTNVGSHAWRMDHPGSDTDLFTCYIAPTRRILRGEVVRPGTHFSQDPGRAIDTQRHEVGAWVHNLLGGNWNYIIGVWSPITVEEREKSTSFLGRQIQAGARWATDLQSPSYLTDLQRLFTTGLSKNCHASIRGLAVHNYRKYLVDPDKYDEETRWKKARQIVRVLDAGIKILSEGKLELSPAHDAKPEDVMSKLGELDGAFRGSKLPEHPPNEEDWRQWLFALRMAELQGEL